MKTLFAFLVTLCITLVIVSDVLIVLSVVDLFSMPGDWNALEALALLAFSILWNVWIFRHVRH